MEHDFFDIVKWRLRGFKTGEYCVFGQEILIISSTEHRKRTSEKENSDLLSDGTLRGFKVDGLFFHAMLLFLVLI